MVDKFHICRYVQWALENIRKKSKKKALEMTEENISKEVDGYY